MDNKESMYGEDFAEEIIADAIKVTVEIKDLLSKVPDKTRFLSELPLCVQFLIDDFAKRSAPDVNFFGLNGTGCADRIEAHIKTRAGDGAKKFLAGKKSDLNFLGYISEAWRAEVSIRTHADKFKSPDPRGRFIDSISTSRKRCESDFPPLDEKLSAHAISTCTHPVIHENNIKIAEAGQKIAANESVAHRSSGLIGAVMATIRRTQCASINLQLKDEINHLTKINEATARADYYHKHPEILTHTQEKLKAEYDGIKEDYRRIIGYSPKLMSAQTISHIEELSVEDPAINHQKTGLVT